MSNPVMAADQKGIQGAGIGIFHGGMLGQFAELPQRGRADWGLLTKGKKSYVKR